MSNIKFARGEDCNFSNKSAKGEFTLFGDQEKKPEKAYTILHFPGGMVEVSRTTDNQYWAHISVKRTESAFYIPGSVVGQTVDARIDAKGRYPEQAIKDEIMATDFEHIAILIKPTLD